MKNKQTIISLICVGMLCISLLAYCLPNPIVTSTSTGFSLLSGANFQDRIPAAMINCSITNLDSLTMTDIQAIDSSGAILSQVNGLKKVYFKGNYYWYESSGTSFRFEGTSAIVYIKMKNNEEMFRVRKIRFVFQNGNSISQQEINFSL